MYVLCAPGIGICFGEMYGSKEISLQCMRVPNGGLRFFSFLFLLRLKSSKAILNAILSFTTSDNPAVFAPLSLLHPKAKFACISFHSRQAG